MSRESMNAVWWATVVSIGLFAALMACLEIGYRIGRRSFEGNPELAHEGIGAIEAAVFTLLGLLLAFSFAGGTSRLDIRRQLIIEETNAINTAYLRLDELPAGDQPAMRALFRRYLDSRIRTFEGLPDTTTVKEELAHSSHIQQELWARAVAASHADQTQKTARLVLPALNAMIDVTTARTMALQTHLPPLIFTLLISVALLSGLLAGYAMAKRKSRSWLHMVLYAAIIAVTIYTVLDLDYPRAGLIHLRAADQALVRLRDSIR